MGKFERLPWQRVSGHLEPHSSGHQTNRRSAVPFVVGLFVWIATINKEALFVGSMTVPSITSANVGNSPNEEPMHTAGSPQPVLEQENLEHGDGNRNVGTGNTNNNTGSGGDDNDNDDDDDDDVTIIGLDNDPEQGNNDQQAAALAWIEQNGPEMEERRRNVLLRELQRVQRASFIHFVLLCLIPTSLLLIVVATVLGEDETCESAATFCEKEARTFINAFTTRCICDAIDVMDEQT